LIPSVAFALLCVELLYIAILAWQSRTLIRTDEANKSPCAGGYSMTHDRLSYRLGPLVAKYSKDTPYWQIVVWTRQIVLTLIDVILTKNFLLSSMSTSAAAYIQAGTNAIFLAIACALNQRYRPYKDQVLPNLSQNALEGSLLAVSSVQALLSCLHFATKDTGGGVFLDVIQVTIVIVQVLFVLCVIGSASGKMKKVADVLAAYFPSSIASEIAKAEEAIEEFEEERASDVTEKKPVPAAKGTKKIGEVRV